MLKKSSLDTQTRVRALKKQIKKMKAKFESIRTSAAKRKSTKKKPDNE